MAERHISFEQLSDVMAFRIIVDDVGDCYRALGLIHQRWPMVPGRYKDYISTP
jgi:(p)ppGpp synthase/HD superfamily hydrolase